MRCNFWRSATLCLVFCTVLHQNSETFASTLGIANPNNFEMRAFQFRNLRICNAPVAHLSLVNLLRLNKCQKFRKLGLTSEIETASLQQLECNSEVGRRNFALDAKERALRD